MRVRTAFASVAVVCATISTRSITSAKSAGFRAIVKSFFNHDDATGDNVDPKSTAIDDRTCLYDWSSLSCVPADKCSIQYTFGDVTPSQACRVTDVGDHTRVPQQLHLAFAGTEPGTGMAISWASISIEDKPSVWLGPSETELVLVKKAKVTVKSYYRDEDYSMFHYHAVVTGLEPNSEYYYKVGSATDAVSQSAVTTLRTSRAVGDPSPFVVAVYGDMGTEANSVAANKYVNNLIGQVEFIYHLGDVSYADNDYLTAKTALGFFYEELWNKFMNSLTNVMRHMAYMVVVGNHEAECHSPTCIVSDTKKDQLGNYTAFNSRFRMPSPESGGAMNMWYSFDYASMHVTTISTETDFPNAPENVYYTNRKYGNFGNQLAWLEADLKAAHANRATVPWIVVGMHRPVYTLRSCDSKGIPTDLYESLKVQKAFEKLFIQYKVDMVFQGHVHAYERTYPTAKNKVYMDGVSEDGRTFVDPKAPVHVIVGIAGNSEGLYPYVNPPAPEWSAYMDNTHYGITKLYGTPTNLTVSMIEASSGKTLDKFSIIKTPT